MDYCNLALIQEAHHRIKGHIHETPVLTCSTLNTISRLDLFFKCEVFQKGGSFKARGAINSVLSLSDAEAAKGVVCHSSGNHAAAVAMAARLRGVPATIVIPRGAPECKVAAVRAYGGTVVECEPTVEAREATCRQVQAATGAAFIAPYNAGPTICGQGTIAVEFLSQVPDLDVIVVPVSGGGMISGIAVAARGIKPSIKIIAAEPVGLNDAADVRQCLEAGRLMDASEVPKPVTLADGLQARLGSLTWPLVRDNVLGCVTVTEGEIIDAMQLIYERMKVVVEPSGAVGLAAALSPQFRAVAGLSDAGAGGAGAAPVRVGVVLCGGNVDLGPLFGQLRERVASGRL